VALYEAGQFEEAAAHFTRSQELYTQLGRANRAAQAAEYSDKAERARLADIEASEARASLEIYDYRAARDNAQEAKTTFTDLGLTTHVEAVDQTLRLAQKGIGAVESLDSARRKAGGFDVTGARADARAAGEVFSELGDTARAAQATALVAELARYSMYMGMGVLAAGVGAVLVGTVIVLRRRWRVARSAGRAGPRRAGYANAHAQLGKESADWL
jgi:tetratricopeptide (TPR) repeat protein